ncbi:hypothetical protein EVAR_10244_1 [Eumeta japonica]|uniref:Uncharacterized protein n=1 Tax=Eumeta variegata TaxID=151549 RepID=A0A4C1TG84_EUMVA|nr:hypothetical protein EVAR_10244_1 [Eumeta japonica]
MKLFQKVHRYVMLHQSSLKRVSNYLFLMSPTDCGWNNVDGKLEPTWFVGNQLPEVYEGIVITPDILENSLDSGTETKDYEKMDQVETNFEDESSDDED